MSGGTFFLLALLGATVAYVGHVAGERRWWGAAGTLLTLAALAALTVGLIVRAARADHWPLTNRFEFALCFIWAILVWYLLLGLTLTFHFPHRRLWARLEPSGETALVGSTGWDKERFTRQFEALVMDLGLGARDEGLGQEEGA